MTDYLKREWQQAIKLGQRNQETIKLARRHCLHMEFVSTGGHGIVEEETGLPIDMRQIRCPVALGSSMASNLELLTGAFYQANCVGCGQRRPTGAIPNLATRMQDAALAEAAAEQQAQAELAGERERWKIRAEERRALGAGLEEVMAGALRDIDVLDPDPRMPSADREREAARERVAVLAERAPDHFTDAVVTAALELVEAGRCPELLDALRRLAARQQQYAERTVRAALAALRLGASPWAGACLAELIAYVARETLAEAVDETVCRSLIWLAGAPALDQLGRSQPDRANDPTGLQAVAAVTPSTVSGVLRAMLPATTAPSALVLPAGAATVARGRSTSDRERAAAANAVRALAATSPQLAAGLVPALIADLAIDPADSFDDPARSAITQTLATLLVLNVGEVASAVDAAIRGAGEEHGERLMHVLSVAADMVSEDPRLREPGDPLLNETRRIVVMGVLLTAAAARIGGDAGDAARLPGAELMERLVRNDPAALLSRLPVVLGTVLVLLDLEEVPATSPLAIGASEPGAMDFFDRMNRETTINGALVRVLNAVKVAATADPLAVCAALSDLIAEERDSERGSDLLRWLLPVLGHIGRRHGEQAGVLRALLPILYSYLLADDALLRARALDAWSEIGAEHTLPASLHDLLPALISDPVIAVATALTRTARRLPWSEEDRWSLLDHARVLLEVLDPTRFADGVKDAIFTALRLAQSLDDEPFLAAVEDRVLATAARLDAHALQDVLRWAWLPRTTRSAAMATLRLRQAVDPHINDRWNGRDDRELTALLACGPGLVDLSQEDLTTAALAHAPEHPLAAAEFAEVAWRAGRPDDAAAIMIACLRRTPEQPAYSGHRQLLELLRTAAEADTEAIAGQDWRAATAQAATAAVALNADEASETRRSLTTLLGATTQVRLLLAGDAHPLGETREVGEAPPAHSALEDPQDPTIALRGRADALEQAGGTLATAAQHATDIGDYLRILAASCILAAHLLRGEAAALDADIERVNAHSKAASRRAQALLEQLQARFADDDPLAAPLRAHLVAAEALAPGSPTGPVLASWATMAMPLPIVRGRRRRTTHQITDANPTHDVVEGQPVPVAVVLASLDGRLVTGPEVLRPQRVYELRVQVQTGPWPHWAQRLDLEILTHLSSAEITLPQFTWARADHSDDPETYTKAGSVLLRFAVGPGQPAPPLLMRLTWRGTHEGGVITQTLDVAGHRELRLRAHDASRDRVTGFSIVDERLLTLYDRLTRVGYDDEQLQAFCRLLTSICRVGFSMTWNKEYRRGVHVTERKFHDDLHSQLLADPELDGRVERGSSSALGYLDVRHDGITAELKVERATPVTKHRASKYMGQATQYASADGARLSILAILDMSPKTLPVGTPENYLFTLEPHLHGLDNPEAPSLVAVLIVNGNLPVPSSYSRRKPPHPASPR